MWSVIVTIPGHIRLLCCVVCLPDFNDNDCRCMFEYEMPIITVNRFGFLFNCTTVGQASDSMMALT